MLLKHIVEDERKIQFFCIRENCRTISVKELLKFPIQFCTQFCSFSHRYNKKCSTIVISVPEIQVFTNVAKLYINENIVIFHMSRNVYNLS